MKSVAQAPDTSLRHADHTTAPRGPHPWSLSRVRWLGLLAVLVLAGCIHGYQAAHPNDRLSLDERSYGHLALSISEAHHYGAKHQKEPFRWPPGAPFAFAAAHSFSGEKHEVSLNSARYVQAVAAVGTSAAVMVIVLVLAGYWFAVLAGVLIATYPPLIYFTATQLSEPLGGFFLVSAVAVLTVVVYLLHNRRGSPSIVKWIGPTAAGGLLAAATLTRADLLPSVILATFLLGLMIWFAKNWKVALQLTLSVAAGFVICLTPWAVYAMGRLGE